MSLNNLSNKFLNRLFKRVDNLVWDFTTGKVGIQDGSGIHTLDVTPAVAAVAASNGVDAVAAQDAIYRTSVNPIEGFGFALPAFATQTAFEKVNIGDLVVSDRDLQGWVIEKKNVSLVLLKKDGTRSTYTPPKVQILGNDGVLVVQNLLNMTGGEGGLGSLQGSLLPLLMMGGDTDIESLLPLLLFTQTTGAAAGGAAAGGLASMLPLLLMSKGKSGNGGGLDIESLLPMLMMGGLGGAGAGATGGIGAMLPLLLMGGLGNKAPALRGRELVGSGVPALQRVVK